MAREARREEDLEERELEVQRLVKLEQQIDHRLVGER